MFVVSLLLIIVITINNDFVWHKKRVDKCDIRVQVYWECSNSTLSSIVLESVWILTTQFEVNKSIIHIYYIVYIHCEENSGFGILGQVV